MRQVARIRMLLYTDYEKKHGKYLYVSSLEILKVIKIKLATLPYPSTTPSSTDRKTTC